MARTRSVNYQKDSGAKIPFVYSKIDPSSGAFFDNTKVTAVAIAIYDRETGASVQGSQAMTYDGTLGGYRYAVDPTAWTARSVRAIMTPTRAGGVSAALTPTDYDDVDLADTLNRLDTRVTEMKGAGFTSADTLHQAKLDRDSIATQIGALDLRQSTSFIVPSYMVAGHAAYVAYLRVRDDNGVLVDADALPSLTALEGSVPGVTLGAFIHDGTGLYHASVAVDNTVTEDTVFNLRAAWNRTEGSVVNNEEAIRSVTVNTWESDHAAIKQNTDSILSLLQNSTYGLSALQVIVANIQSQVNNGTYGLPALRTDIDAVAAEIGLGTGTSVHQKLGAFTAVLNLFGMLGTFTTTETLKKNIEVIQGSLG